MPLRRLVKTRLATARSSDGLTPLAIAAGLVFGNVVVAMAETGRNGFTAQVAALVFAAAASAAVLCTLAEVKDRAGTRSARAVPPRWIVAIGIGWMIALAPRLF